MSNYVQQFGSMLGEMEDGETKTNLLNAFGNVRLDFDQAIQKRVDIKNDFDSYKSSVTSKLGTDISEYTVPTQSDDLEKLKQDLETKYNTDTQQLRDNVSEWENKYTQSNTKLEDMLFSSEVEKAGLLTGFNTENPMVKDMLLKKIKDSLILQEGVFYVKDGTTGDKARDIKTGEFLPAKSVSDGMLASPEWTPFVSPKAQASGMGTQTTTTTTTGKKFADYTSGELVEMRRTNPAQYELLKSQG